MNAIRVVDGRLIWGPAPDPVPGPGEVRIRVAATAVNRADLLQRVGMYPPPPGASDILGLECSGHIDAVGPDVTDWREGDAVCALLAGGGYAERVVCAAVQCLPVPERVSVAHAAAIPECFAAAWLNLWDEAGLQPGERVVVHAGASGVGTAAIQLCRVAGNPVAVTVGSEAKADRCLDLGADLAVDRKAGPWVEGIAAWAGPHGVDVILDPVGGGYLADNVKSLAIGGRLVVIGLMGGASAGLDVGRLLVKRLRVIGSTLRARDAAEKGRILRGLQAAAWPAFASGRIRPIIDRELPIAAVEDAHAIVASDATVGKVLLAIGG